MARLADYLKNRTAYDVESISRIEELEERVTAIEDDIEKINENGAEI